MSAVFFVNGLALASWVPHVPAVKRAHGLTDGALGAVLLCMAVGALVALARAGGVVARLGSRRATAVAALALVAVLPGPLLAPSVPLLALALLGLGAANATLDVAMNAQAVELERRRGRAIMSSFHALFSLGGLAGAAAAGAAVAHGVTPVAHLAATALAAAGALAFCGLLTEGAMADWSAVYLHDTLGGTPAVAAAGFAACSLAMAAGRLGGDRLVGRFGPTTVLRASSAVAAAGLGNALLRGDVASGIVGFGLVGLGIANVVPILFSAAGRVPGTEPGAALATVATTGYVGFLAGPPLIGLAADAAGLRAALGLVVALSAAIACAAGVVAPHDRRRVAARRALVAAVALGFVAAADGRDAAARVERLDPRLDALLPADARLETVARGFAWAEGPVWDAAAGALFFSDVPRNAVYRWTARGGVAEHLRPSGYTGDAPFAGREPGANGLALDRDGRLLLCQHGDRRVARLERDGRLTVLADRYEGRRLNSPNDLALRPDGALWFTDPPFGLPRAFDDPAKELPFQGVFRLADGHLDAVVTDLRAPNGLGFSPDGHTLYVSHADPAEPVWMAYPVDAGGGVGAGREFADARAWAAPGTGAPDGLEVDRDGNVFAAGPGGVHVFAPDGTRLGRIVTGVATGNVGWGADGALWITAGEAVLRVRTATGPAAPTPARRLAAARGAR